MLVPGLQGRWEWMQPAVARLAERFRVVAYSLCDERTSGFGCEPTLGFANYVRQLDEVLDRARLDRATLVGVSYGGLIATEFAATHAARVSGLVLASALPRQRARGASSGDAAPCYGGAPAGCRCTWRT